MVENEKLRDFKGKETTVRMGTEGKRKQGDSLRIKIERKIREGAETSRKCKRKRGKSKSGDLSG